MRSLECNETYMNTHEYQVNFGDFVRENSISGHGRRINLILPVDG